MTDTELPWTIFGRKMRPFSLALALSTLVISYATLRGVAVGVGLDGNSGKIVGVVGILSVLMLFAGFWFRSDKWMTRGLLFSTGVWASTAAFLALDIGITAVSSLSAACWGIAAAGAWLLEVSNR